VLEAPPQTEAPSAGMGGVIGLFADESMAVIASKFSLVEAFLRSVTRDQPYSDFSREILMATMKVVKCEAGSLLEVDHRQNTIFFRAVVGTRSDRVAKFTVPMGQGIVGHVAESRRPLLVSNVGENQLHLKAIAKAVGFETRNLVAVPILVRGKIHSVLELLNRVGEPEFTQADADLLAYACEMAGKAIEARLMIAWGAAKRQKEAA
jgi:signal transduction protein with GAF and PtsI domain